MRLLCLSMRLEREKLRERFLYDAEKVENFRLFWILPKLVYRLSQAIWGHSWVFWTCIEHFWAICEPCKIIRNIWFSMSAWRNCMQSNCKIYKNWRFRIFGANNIAWLRNNRPRSFGCIFRGKALRVIPRGNHGWRFTARCKLGHDLPRNGLVVSAYAFSKNLSCGISFLHDTEKSKNRVFRSFANSRQKALCKP